MSLFKVSQSKVKTYLRCHRAYHNRYVEQLRRKRIKRPFMFGTIIHKMIETYANGDDPFEVLNAIDLENAKLFASEKEMYGEIIEDVRLIMTDYFDYWPEKDLIYLRRHGKGSEHVFEIELPGDILWNGKIDAVGQTPNKLRWLVEHKTFTRMPGEDDRWRSLQSVSYIRALDILGWKSVDGTCWDYIRSKPPTRPGELKDGSLSKKKIDSLPSAVLATIMEYGFDPKDYEQLLISVETNRADWFSRIHTPVTRSVADNVFDSFHRTALEIADLHGKVDTMSIERHCSWCDYEPLCRAELLGNDVDYVKQKEYYHEEADPKSDGPADEDSTD